MGDFPGMPGRRRSAGRRAFGVSCTVLRQHGRQHGRLAWSGHRPGSGSSEASLGTPQARDGKLPVADSHRGAGGRRRSLGARRLGRWATRHGSQLPGAVTGRAQLNVGPTGAISAVHPVLRGTGQTVTTAICRECWASRPAASKGPSQKRTATVQVCHPPLGRSHRPRYSPR